MEIGPLDIAIVGISARFPGAPDVDAFWKNLAGGTHSITKLEDSKGVSANPHRVSAGYVLGNTEMFDPDFFGMTPREAEILDPQHRVFMESVWEALERAGYEHEAGGIRIGVFGASFFSTYLLELYKNPEVMRSAGLVAIRHGNDKDYLANRVSYKLDFTGPSVNVQTSCSSGLSAVHLACQSLLNHECDVAAAGAVSIQSPEEIGYTYENGGFLSPDGFCRAFDRDARGTVFGSGAGVVALRRLADALEANDHIHAVISATAMNNDGARKVGFTAPSVEGQASVIREALAAAGVESEAIGYVEAHGTGTLLGDPIEIRALTKAFNAKPGTGQYCGIGSVKTNIGHCGAAAGIAGLIKAALSVERGLIPASLHFNEPNPEISFSNTPFYVNTTLKKWRASGKRRAGVSSFGMGGTNVHAVISEAPARPIGSLARPRVYPLSARSEAALRRKAADLADLIDRDPTINLGDLAFTLQTRRCFAWRDCVVGTGVDEVRNGLQEVATGSRRLIGGKSAESRVGFVFGGDDPSLKKAALVFAEEEPVFRDELKKVANTSAWRLSREIQSELGKAEGPLSPQLLFAVQYALARLWEHWGIAPVSVAGDRNGFLAAAAVAKAIDCDCALEIISGRRDLIHLRPALPSLPIWSPHRRIWTNQLETADFSEWNDEAFRIGMAGNELFLVMGTPVSIDLLDLNTARNPIVATFDKGEDPMSDALRAAGAVWMHGGKLHLGRISKDENIGRIPLPTYPFERRRYFVTNTKPVDDVTPGPKAPSVEHTDPPPEKRDQREAEISQNDQHLGAVIEIFEQILGRTGIKKEDDLFALGLTSLTALTAGARLRERFNVEIGLQDLFEVSNAGELAEVIQRHRDAQGQPVPDDLQEILDELNALSDEEVQKAFEAGDTLRGQ